MEELKRRQLLMDEINDLCLQLEKYNKKIDINLDGDIKYLEQQRNNLLSFIICKEVNNTVSYIDNSTKNDNIKDNLLNYESLIIDVISKINDAYKKDIDFNPLFLERFCNIIYNVIKYFIIYDMDVSELFNNIKSVSIIEKNIIVFIRSDINYVVNSRDNFDDLKEFRLLVEGLDNKLLDERLIKEIVMYILLYRNTIDEELLINYQTLNEENRNLLDKISELECELEKKNKFSNVRKNKLNKIKKSYISLVLSFFLLCGVFTISNVVTRKCVDYFNDNVSDRNSFDSSFKEKNLGTIKNILSGIISIWGSFIFSCVPNIGIREVYKKYRLVLRELDETLVNIKKVSLSIMELQESLKMIENISDDIIRESNHLFSEMYHVLGYYYVSSEEEKLVSDLKSSVKETLVLKNKILDLN